MEKLDCKRCGHKWFQRTELEPKMCPACKSRKYKEEKEKPGN